MIRTRRCLARCGGAAGDPRPGLAIGSGAESFLLECGGKIAAASVNFVYAGRMEAYFTSYDATFDRASPGTILIVEYARWSFDRGLRHVDFLRGEEAFKFRMANAETVLSSFSGARTLMGQVAVSGHRWLSRRRQRQEVAHTPSGSMSWRPWARSRCRACRRCYRAGIIPDDLVRIHERRYVLRLMASCRGAETALPDRTLQPDYHKRLILTGNAFFSVAPVVS